MSAPRHTLHIVSGKGGVGKTTIAGALACALATRGRRVLLCEVEGRQGIAELFAVPDLVGAEERRVSRTPFGGSVFGLAIDAEDALLEYLETFYHLGIAGKALDRFGAVDFATSIAPGLATCCSPARCTRRSGGGEKRAANAYDAVVLDAPPTGPDRPVPQRARGGVRAGQGRPDPPPGRLDHAGAALGDHGGAPGHPAGGHAGDRDRGGGAGAPADPHPGRHRDREHGQLLAPGARRAGRRGPRRSDHGRARPERRSRTPRWPRSSPLEAARTRQQQRRHRRLTELGLPIAAVDFDPVGIDEGAVFAIAEQLRDQLTLESRMTQ